MALVMIVTRDVADRFHGFLASVMLEVAPNVFVSPRMNTGVRDLNVTGGVGVAHLGTPPRELVEVDGMWLTRRSKLGKAL